MVTSLLWEHATEKMAIMKDGLLLDIDILEKHYYYEE